MSLARIHPSAVVDEGAIIGEDSRIWHFCHVSGGARLGRDCVLGQNVFVAARALLGESCRVQNNVSLYDDVILEDHVFCGPSCVFTNVLTPRAHVQRKDEYLVTRVCHHASIGANATIVCGNTIGAYAFIAAGSVVTRSVPEHALMMGNPARRRGWVCRCGVVLKGFKDGHAECPRCGDRYEDQGDKLVLTAPGKAGA